MRVLFTTTGGAGHVGPFLPFARALRAAGHEVRVAVRRANAATVVAAGLPVRVVDDAPPEPRTSVFAHAAGLSADRANRLVVGEIFAGIDAPAALPGMQAAIEEWRPDVLVHESCEFAGPLAAERAGVPVVHIPIALVATDELLGPSAVRAVARMRERLGLRPARRGGWPTYRPVLTLTPPSLEDPAAPGPAHIRRYRDDEAPAGALPDWWDGREEPLVYLTFGSVAPTMSFFPGLYRGAIAALAELPVRVLVTIGRAQDPAALGELPPNVHVERWVPQATVAPHAAAIVCHGGFGTVRAAVCAGLPQVVLPLFADQPYNARRIADLGAGIALQGGPAQVGGLAQAVERVLGDPRYAAAAARVAAEARAMPPASDAVDVFTDLAVTAAAA
jgi:UDP:flavonoid glycosyltransferase YjiC (YdhE family)